MRVLLVAESVEIVSELQRIFRSQPGYETFGYAILLKALDNIEEINPDIVCVSAADYPRHWKLLVRHLCSPLYQSAPTIVLLTDSKFDEEERQKAKTLGVRKIIDEGALSLYTSADSFLGDAEPAEIAAALPPEAKPAPAKHKPPVLAERIQCLITDPESGSLITGVVTSCGKNTFTFKPDQDPVSHFEAGEIIDSCSLKIDGKTQAAVLQMLGTDNGEFKLKVRKIQPE
jgi:hypothetical protein